MGQTDITTNQAGNARTYAGSSTLTMGASTTLTSMGTVSMTGTSITFTDIDCGASGIAGSVDIFPSTASKGKFSLTCTDQIGDTTVTLKPAAMGQATTITIPDPGAATSYLAQSTAALTLAEVDVLDGVTAGTAVASKAVVLDGSGDVSLPGTVDFLGATPLTFSAAGTTRAIDIQITPTTADNQIYVNVDYGANANEAMYVISSSAKTSGETVAGKFRGQGKAAGASTAEINGVHAQGIAFEALYTGTVNAIYAEAIAKGTSTVTTIRGAMIACDSENTPTSITNMYGAHIRIKTSVAPGTAFIGTIIETEKFGSGIKADSLLDLRSTTWGAAEESVTAIIDMSNFGSKASHAHIRFPITGAMDNDSTQEGDFWYDVTGHVFKYRDNVGVKTITAA